VQFQPEESHAEPKLHVHRASIPPRPLHDVHDKAVYESLGGQYEWNLAVPWVFRALASPATNEPILSVPKPGDPVEHACAYWTSLRPPELG